MSWSNIPPKDKDEFYAAELLASVEAFLDAHYEFRNKSKYSGLLRRINGYFDRIDLEKREKQETGARFYRPQFEDVESTVFYSEPPRPLSKEELEEKARKKAEEHLRLAIELSFSTALMELIKAKGMDHVEVYKRANIDRKLFSKIRIHHEYIPSKRTIIALALALELSLEETQRLLEKAGFTLSRSILFDVIIEYFISHGKYDIFEINSVLFVYKQPIFD